MGILWFSVVLATMYLQTGNSLESRQAFYFATIQSLQNFRKYYALGGGGLIMNDNPLLTLITQLIPHPVIMFTSRH